MHKNISSFKQTSLFLSQVVFKQRIYKQRDLLYDENTERKRTRYMDDLFKSNAIQEAFQFIKEDAAQCFAQQLELVQLPAYTGQEQMRGKRFKELMEQEGYKATVDSVGNVYTIIKGEREKPCLYVTAHLDTVFPMDIDLTVKRVGERYCVPGIGDDTRGLAEILAILRCIKHTKLLPQGTLIIGANVGEEGQGNLLGVRHFFANPPVPVDGFISLDLVGNAIIYGGTGSHRYKVSFRAPGGHSFNAFGLVNPIHAMGRAISYISDIQVPQEPKTTFSVSVVEGGSSVNTIPGACSMLIDMRSNDSACLERLDAEMHDCVYRAVENENERWARERETLKTQRKAAFDTEARINTDIQCIGDRPVGHQALEDTIVQRAYKAACLVEGAVPQMKAYSSTDANLPISMGIPAVTLGCGGKGGNVHSLSEWYDPTDSYKGVQRNLLTVFALIGLQGISEPALERIRR